MAVIARFVPQQCGGRDKYIILHDPRGLDRGGVRRSSVSLRFESGVANSLTGNWKVPVLADDYKQLGHDFARQCIDACKQDDHKVASFEHAGYTP